MYFEYKPPSIPVGGIPLFLNFPFEYLKFQVQADTIFLKVDPILHVTLVATATNIAISCAKY